MQHKTTIGDPYYGILNDAQIKELCRADRPQGQMIEPFIPSQIKTVNDEKIISYGLSSFGYDIRCADEFKVFTNSDNAVVDPKNLTADAMVDKRGPYCIIPPNSFALARSLEYLRVPKDCIVVTLGKSTYARVGLIVNVTPLEPEWEGHITLEFSNTTPCPVKVYANEGIAQLLFFTGMHPDVSYRDRGGKYMGQTGITLPKV